MIKLFFLIMVEKSLHRAEKSKLSKTTLVSNLEIVKYVGIV